MSSHADEIDEALKARAGKRRFRWLLWVGGAICVLGIAVSLIPTLDGPNMRRAANEAVAVGKLQRLTTLQTEYAAAHPSLGFSCKLAELRLTPPSNGGYDTDEFLVRDSFAGYRFVIIGCETAPGGAVIRYRVTAVPVTPGRTGVHAFCTDQSGGLWHDPTGSADTCLAVRRPI